MYDDTVASNPRDPGTDKPEDKFRYAVRDLLGLSWDTRDDRILDEIRLLKKRSEVAVAKGPCDRFVPSPGIMAGPCAACGRYKREHAGA